jgi:ClpP class serine protease
MILAQEPEFTVRYLERIENATAEEQQAAFDRFDDQSLPSILEIDGNVARISISGPLSPKGPSALGRFFGFGGTGYQDIINAVHEVLSDASITEVRFPANTPGGTVTMVDETRQAIAELAKVKRVVFENHGMIASAGIWLASAAHEIVAMSPTVESGAIGVKIVGYDDTAALKEWGYKKVTILSRNAPNKAAGVDTKDGRNELQRQADAVERIFIARIAEGRGVTEQAVIDTFGKGGMLVAQDPDKDKPDAVSVGLIDRIAEGFEVAESVAEDAEDDLEVSNQQNSNPSGLKQKGAQGSANSSTQENKTMSLKSLLAENPDAQAEFDVAIKSAQETGASEGQTVIDARIEVAKPFMAADSKYPQAIRVLATQVMTGEADASALTAAVAAVDAVNESTASANAGSESEEQGDTSAQEHTQGRGKGVTETNEDFDASVSSARESRGLEA